MTATILFITSNPFDTPKIDAESEVRIVRESVSRSIFRVELIPAARAADFQRSLIETQPVIVHWSGHGMERGRPGEAPGRTRDLLAAGEDPEEEPWGTLVVQDEHGRSEAVPTQALADLFRILRDEIPTRCVVLNACFTEEQAAAIAEHIDFVIGTTRAIPDEAAITFSKQFYYALAEGRSLLTAFELGRNAVALAGGDSTVLKSWCRPGVDPRHIRLRDDRASMPPPSPSWPPPPELTTPAPPDLHAPRVPIDLHAPGAPPGVHEASVPIDLHAPGVAPDVHGASVPIDLHAPGVAPDVHGARVPIDLHAPGVAPDVHEARVPIDLHAPRVPFEAPAQEAPSEAPAPGPSPAVSAPRRPVWLLVVAVLVAAVSAALITLVATRPPGGSGPPAEATSPSAAPPAAPEDRTVFRPPSAAAPATTSAPETASEGGSTALAASAGSATGSDPAEAAVTASAAASGTGSAAEASPSAGAPPCPATCCGGAECGRGAGKITCLSGRACVPFACDQRLPPTDSYRLRVFRLFDQTPGRTVPADAEVCMRRAAYPDESWVCSPYSAILESNRSVLDPARLALSMADMTTTGIDFEIRSGKGVLASRRNVLIGSHFNAIVLCIGLTYKDIGRYSVIVHLDDPS